MVQLSAGDKNSVGFKCGIVVHCNIGSTAENLKDIAEAFPIDVANVIEDIVTDENPLGLLARMDVVRAQDVHAGGDVSDEIVSERDVANHGPW